MVDLAAFFGWLVKMFPRQQRKKIIQIQKTTTTTKEQVLSERSGFGPILGVLVVDDELAQMDPSGLLFGIG